MKLIQAHAKTMAFVMIATGLAGCSMPTDDPRDVLGATPSQAGRLLGARGTIMYNRVGVNDPNSYTGEIALSPFHNHHLPQGIYSPTQATCTVKNGTITECSIIASSTPDSPFFKWLKGQKLASIPPELYLELDENHFGGSLRIDEHKGDMDRFNGQIMYTDAKRVYHLTFIEGVCTGVLIE
ncbi:MAG TPA: hypothetical protein PLB31_12455 [Fimbriimonadaceae bacterium]|nr:hypothetical protein [Armatimonadota bacterium]HRD30242.1 hypothetical protein [Fimbriimonadaceae bacterium]HRE94529.1 hypothetical protein [Fimbriimonadaceae bacterium]HRI75268.1 hypothetical protein [Fimbriimonadaceae bacterium]